jgi:hypothetical protein
MSKVYVGDTGTAIVLDTLQDLTGASLAAIEVRKPSGALLTWTGSVFETTKVRFITLADTLDIPGEWAMQAKVTMPSGSWLGEVALLRVYAPFN